MISISGLLFEDVNTAEIDIQKDPELSKADKNELNKLMKEFDQAEMSHDKEYYSIFKNKLSNFSIEYHLQDWKNRGMVLYVLRRNNKIIGFCSVKIQYPLMTNTIYISYLCISKKERFSGYGRYFLNYIIKDLQKEYPGKNLAINVFDRNTVAKKLYSSLGFRPGTIFMLNFSK